ncbi:MAG TPA: hypothetical protein VGM19_00740 [Armatimonadota bacterium]|jgi:hypothetical protein
MSEPSITPGRDPLAFTLREHLGVPWTQELVSYPLALEAGALRHEAVALEGPEGLRPAQLAEVVCWPGTSFVQTATLWFVVDQLPPLAERTWRLVNAAPPATDLRVAPAAASVEITTEHFGLRCPLGERAYPVPTLAAEVPGPVLGLRLPDGSWFGGSRLYGERRVAAWSARVTATGPVFAEVAFEYVYEGGLTMSLTARVVAGDSHAHWTMAVEGDELEAGWQLDLTPGLSAFVLDQIPWEYHKNTWGAEELQAIDVVLDDYAPGLLTNLVPWEDWWDDQTQTSWVIKTAGRGRTLEIGSEDPGDWVEPAPQGTLGTWDAWLRKTVALCRDADGRVFLQINAASGRRAWRVGAYQAAALSVPAYRLTAYGQREETRPVAVGRLLDTVKDYVLAWPGEAGAHPHLFLSAEELREMRTRPVDPARLAALVEGSHEESHGLPHVADADALGAYLLTGDPQVAAATRVVERLRNHLALFGAFDTMRFVPHLVALYDALIDEPLVSDEERAMLSARMAYLGYSQASPARWSNERGYRSYNLNMSVSHTLHLGMIACTLPTHPLARTWVQPALELVDDLLNEVGPAGEWPESVSNYVHVSGSALLLFALTAQSAGFRDFVNDPRMKLLLDYIAKMYAPCDLLPREPGEPSWRGLPPHGRAQAGHRFGLPGMMARATRDSDPAYSAAQQWVWQQMGECREIPNASLGGFEQVYLDASLPAARPAWESEQFPQAGVILRQGLGTPEEYYVNVISADFPHQVFAAETGALSLLCAKGAPLAGAFYGGYGEREELLASRVCLARGVGSDGERRARVGYTGTVTSPEEESTGRRRPKPLASFGEQPGVSNVSSFSALPRQDYATVDVALVHPQRVGWPLVAGLPEWPAGGEGAPPVDWRRQVLFLKGEDAGDASYLLFRDTVRGGQPTMWQMWTLSDGLDAPDEVSASAGRQILPARCLEGDRFTARGQFGVDVEYFIASPADTPRHTLRWGTTYEPHRASWHPLSVLRDNYSEYRDLLHLQLPGDGAYFVAFFPRRAGETAPNFTAWGGGLIIRTTGDWGTDYGFLSATEAQAEGDSAVFRGTAGSVQDRRGERVLSLGAAGEVQYQDLKLAASGAVGLRVSPEAATLELPPDHEAAEVTVALPGRWALASPAPGVTLEADAAGYRITIPPGLSRVALTAG